MGEEDGDIELDILPEASQPERLGVVVSADFTQRTCGVHWLGTDEREALPCPASHIRV